MDIGGPVGRFIKSTIKYAESGFSNVDDQTYQDRLSACYQCDQYFNGICLQCKCILIAKARMATEDCPLKKWDNIDLSTPIQNNMPCGGCVKAED